VEHWPSQNGEKCKRIAWQLRTEHFLRGKVEAGRQTNKPAELKAAVATATGKAGDSTSVNFRNGG